MVQLIIEFLDGRVKEMNCTMDKAKECCEILELMDEVETVEKEFKEV